MRYGQNSYVYQDEKRKQQPVTMNPGSSVQKPQYRNGQGTIEQPGFRKQADYQLTGQNMQQPAMMTGNTGNQVAPSVQPPPGGLRYPAAGTMESADQQQTQTPAVNYNQQLDALYQQIMNREPFQFNLNENALYQQLRDSYIQGGSLAMMDTMGQAAALTGGYGNSYAQGVGQQAYQQYMQGLNDEIPGLYEMALNQYMMEGDALYDQIGALQWQAQFQEDQRRNDQAQDRWQSEFDESKRQDALDREQWQSEFDEAKRQDELDRGQWQSEFDEMKRQDELDRGQWREEFDEEKRQDELDRGQWQEEFDEMKRQDELDRGQWREEFDEDKRRYDQAWEQEYGTGVGGGGTGGSSSGSGAGSGSQGSPDADTSEIQQMLQDAGYDIAVDGIWGPETQQAYEDYMGQGGDDTGAAMSEAGQQFMSQLPYLQAGGDVEGWKRTVAGRLYRALENGTLTEDDAILIAMQLGLEDIEPDDRDYATSEEDKNKDAGNRKPGGGGNNGGGGGGHRFEEKSWGY